MVDLNMGTYETLVAKPYFLLPGDAQVQTFGIIGVRGSGKTVTATVMAEEFCRNGLLWAAFDPISVWWGLRAKRDGAPGGYPVLVFGGPHGDIQIQKTDGRRIAEVVAQESVCAVIDVKRESKAFWHTFITDLSLGLMDESPKTPRHIFIEEAPEFVPQKPKSELSRRACEAVERLVRLGRNQGYGCTLIGQRSATINKDVLSQCENIFAMRTVGHHDYKAFQEWLIAAGIDKSRAREILGDLSRLPSGTANFWSPFFMQKFERVLIRQRTTFHPGDTRKVGVAAKQVELAPLHETVKRVQGLLTRTVQAVPSQAPERPTKAAPARSPSPVQAPRVHPETTEELARLRVEVEALRLDNAKLRNEVRECRSKLEGVRKTLEPQYRALQGLFSEIGATQESYQGNPEVWEDWLKKAGVRGCRRILEVMLERRSLKAIQLATLSGISYRTLKNYRGWLKSNGLVQIDGEGEGATFSIVPLA